MEEMDTREKLEADAKKRFPVLWEIVLEYCDRQTAIAEREIREREQYGEKVIMLQSVVDELHARLDCLEAHGVTISEPFHGGYEVYNEQKRRADNLQAKVDELTEQLESADSVADDQREQIDALTAEVEAQRERANKAEKGVLHEGWYVSRDRYEDDIAELAAERDEQRKRKARAEQKLNALVNRLKVQHVHLLWNDAYSDWTVSLPLDVLSASDLKRIEELTAERDRLQEIVDDWGAGTFYAKLCEAREERNRLQRVVRAQADSFKALEREIAVLKADSAKPGQ